MLVFEESGKPVLGENLSEQSGEPTHSVRRVQESNLGHDRRRALSPLRHTMLPLNGTSTLIAV